MGSRSVWVGNCSDASGSRAVGTTRTQCGANTLFQYHLSHSSKYPDVCKFPSTYKCLTFTVKAGFDRNFLTWTFKQSSATSNSGSSEAVENSCECAGHTATQLWLTRATNVLPLASFFVNFLSLCSILFISLCNISSLKLTRRNPGLLYWMDPEYSNLAHILHVF